VRSSRFLLLPLLSAALMAAFATPAAWAAPVAPAVYVSPAAPAARASGVTSGARPGAPPALARTASLTGTVLGAGGRPLAHACVAATGSGTSFPALTDAAGQYRLTVPAPGTYTLAFSGCAAGRYRTEWSGGSMSAAGARPVQLAAGSGVTVPPMRLESLSGQAATSGLAGALALARASGAVVRAPTTDASTVGISGVVRNAAGRKLAGACVLLTGRTESSTSGGIVSVSQEDELTFTDAPAGLARERCSRVAGR
jgi:hypothetical protein